MAGGYCFRKCGPRKSWIKCHLSITQVCVSILALPLTSCVIWGKLLNLWALVSTPVKREKCEDLLLGAVVEMKWDIACYVHRAGHLITASIIIVSFDIGNSSMVDGTLRKWGSEKWNNCAQGCRTRGRGMWEFPPMCSKVKVISLLLHCGSSPWNPGYKVHLL